MNRITDYGKLATDISNWIKQYATDNNIKSLVVGVSGGIDSAVVSTLCAMTGIETWLCVLPIESNDAHTKVAQRHCDWLQGNYPPQQMHMYLADCSNPFTKLSGLLGGCKEQNKVHTLANMKSRIRMTMLYAVATQYDGIVVGTGNKVEDFGVKFFTKYGDGGVDISPIADLYKTEVRELGRYLGVSEEIINAVPTDGLWADGRSDESVLKCTYEELEWAMEELQGIDYISVENMIPFKILNRGKYSTRQIEVIDRYAELYARGMHKVLPIPIFKLS